MSLLYREKKLSLQAKTSNELLEQSRGRVGIKGTWFHIVHPAWSSKSTQKYSYMPSSSFRYWLTVLIRALRAVPGKFRARVYGLHSAQGGIFRQLFLFIIRVVSVAINLRLVNSGYVK